MDKRTFKGIIFYKVDSTHPDIECIKEKDQLQSFDDTYYIDNSRFDSDDQIISKIEYDLSLVAGGGYSTEHISNVSFQINEL